MLTIILIVVACVILAPVVCYTVFVLAVGTLMVIQSIIDEPRVQITQKEKKVLFTLAINE